MEHDHKPDGQGHPTVLCPICGTPLVFGLLEVTEDDSKLVKLLTYDCPTGDYHGAMRETEFIELAAREVVRRLR